LTVSFITPTTMASIHAFQCSFWFDIHLILWWIVDQWKNVAMLLWTCHLTHSWMETKGTWYCLDIFLFGWMLLCYCIFVVLLKNEQNVDAFFYHHLPTQQRENPNQKWQHIFFSQSDLMKIIFNLQNNLHEILSSFSHSLSLIDLTLTSWYGVYGFINSITDVWL
jgi:hypothetical protein